MAGPDSFSRNLGPRSRQWLAEIDIHGQDDLKAIGAVEAYCRLKFRFGRSITRNMLHAMAASLLDLDWRLLTPEHKAELDRAVAMRSAEQDLR